MSYLTVIKRLLAILFCLLLTHLSNAQSKADSLKALLPSLTDTLTKIDTQLKIAEELYQTGQRKEALLYAKKTLDASHRHNHLKGEGNSLLLIGHAKLTSNKYDSALTVFHQAESCFEKTGYTLGLIRTYTYMGQAFDVLAKYDEAIRILQKARLLAEKEAVPDKNRLANIHNSLGVSYLNKGSYELAMDHNYKALPYAEAAGNKRLQAGILNNIGIVSIRVYDYKKASEIFSRLLDLARQQENPPLIALALSNLGDSYAHTGDFQKAEQFLTEAIETRKKLNDNRGITYTLSNLAYLRRQEHKLQESQKIYQQSIDLASTFDENELMLTPLTGIIKVNILLKNLSEAATQIQEGRKIANTIGSKFWARDILLLASQLDSARGDFRNAYQWYKKYTALDDSLFTERKSLQVEEMKVLYESEKKDQEIQFLNEVKKRKELEFKNDQRFYIILAVVFSMLVILLLYWLRNKMQTERILKQQKKEVSDANEEMHILIGKIEEQNDVLAIKNEKLEDLHREKDGMISIVAHDLRSPLNKVASLTELITLTGPLNTEQQQMTTRIQKVCEDGNSLIRDLMELHQLEDETSEASVTTFEIKTTLENWLDNYNTLLQNKRLNLEVDLGPNTQLLMRGDLFCLTRVLDNILTNAIKFSPFDRTIYFRLQTDNDKIKITIQDEGQGFQPQDIPHLFKKFKKLSARPTAGEPSTGLGLSIVKALVGKMKGEIEVQNSPKGAAFIITLPIELTPLVHEYQ